MSETQKWIHFTAKLLEATQKGSLKWIARQNTMFGKYYEAKFLDQNFRVLKNPATGVRLFFIDESLPPDILFEVPPNEGLPHLFSAIQRQAANVDAIVERVLAFNP